MQLFFKKMTSQHGKKDLQIYVLRKEGWSLHYENGRLSGNKRHSVTNIWNTDGGCSGKEMCLPQAPRALQNGVHKDFFQADCNIDHNCLTAAMGAANPNAAPQTKQKP